MLEQSLLEQSLIEEKLIEHCAPTLAGLKSANLFNYRFISPEYARKELDEANQKLNMRGVYVEDLSWTKEMVLIYTYRKSHLEKELQQEKVQELLKEYGYTDFSVEACLQHVKNRLDTYECFPHEIGVFLGYPIEDVIGFINNKGKNCKCCGVWKVYCNEREKQLMFEKLKKCTMIYLRVFAEGRSITQMTVSA